MSRGDEFGPHQGRRWRLPPAPRSWPGRRCPADLMIHQARAQSCVWCDRWWVFCGQLGEFDGLATVLVDLTMRTGRNQEWG